LQPPVPTQKKRDKELKNHWQESAKKLLSPPATSRPSSAGSGM
jgi:hypothetical protein